MSNQDQTESLERNIAKSKKFLELGAALERLHSNKDFLAVVKQGYFEQEAIRLVHLRADPARQSVESQDSIIKQIDAIAGLHSYFRTVFFSAEQASRSIESDEATLEELHAEGIAE